MAGRPRKYESAEELEAKINEYFNGREYNEITITGLCLFLGINKDTFYEYAKVPEYKYIIDVARLRVENSYEIALRKDGGTENIFALKNFGWKDKQEFDTADNGLNINIKATSLTDEDVKRVEKLKERLFKNDN